MKPILSVRDLASRLGISVQRLRQIANEIDSDIYSHYQLRTKVDKRTGKVRHCRVPKPELKDLQRRIHRIILRPIPLSDTAHGGVQKRSPRTNASQHLGKPCVVNIDVKSFFPSVRHYIVHKVLFDELNFGREVAWLLTRLTTLNAALPQGAPTSSAVANVLLTSAVDAPITVAARAIRADSTRFVDDVTFSGSDPRSLINATARALSRRRLKMHRETAKTEPKPKFKITPRSRRQEVTGLVVNSIQGRASPKNVGTPSGLRSFSWAA